MADAVDNVVIYFVTAGNRIYEVNMVTGHYFHHTNPNVLAARKRALTWAGTPWKVWTHSVIGAMDAQFGLEEVNGPNAAAANPFSKLVAAVAGLKK